MDTRSETLAHTAARAEARRRIEHAARDSGILLSGLRLRLNAPDPESAGSVLAQANAHADGHPLRVQVVAHTVREAVDALSARTADRLGQTQHAWTPRPWSEEDRRPPGAAVGAGSSPVAGGDARIVRVKTYPLTVCAPQVAAAYMDAMDYDIHLFIEQETWQTCAVRRAGPTGYRLTRLHPAAPPRQTQLPLAIDPRPAPMLTAAAAVARLEETGDAHLFFADPGTGHGHLVYRRYDGHYALVTGGANAAAVTAGLSSR